VEAKVRPSPRAPGRARYGHLADCRENRFVTQLTVTGLLAAGAGDGALARLWETQQFCQGTGSRLVHRGADQHLDGFQIDLARLANAGEDTAQQLVYFARDFLLDDLCRFFSCSFKGSSSTGRSRQIFSLTSTSSRPNRW